MRPHNRNILLGKYNVYAIVAVSLLCLSSRIPQLLSPYLLLDGDESVVGLMAKHLYEGKELSMYFWGQQYGFSAFECLLIVPFYAVLGITTLAVKLGMLTLWTIGVIFLYKMLCVLNEADRRLPFLLTVIFILHPAWAVWSMKARGGYLTAFTLSHIALYMLLHPTTSKRLTSYLIIGILLPIIFESQAFWLAGVMPVLLYKIYHDKNWRASGLLILTASTVYFSLLIYKSYLMGETYSPPVIIPQGPEILAHLERIPEFLFASLHGNYYFSIIQRPGLFCVLLSCVAIAIVFSILAIAAYYLICRRKTNTLLIVSTVFIPILLLATLFSPEIQPRYLLPLTGFAMLPLQLLLNKVKKQTALTFGIFIIALVGFGCMISFAKYEFLPNRKAVVSQLRNYFKQNNVTYAFSTDGMISWQIIFYTQEQVIVRTAALVERYPDYGIRVNRALRLGERTAIICYAGELEEFKADKPLWTNGFGVGMNPDKGALGEYFMFPHP